MKLVASMIVHNEMDRYLPLAVEHLLTFCDELRIMDDSSQDGTFDWLASLREPVYVSHNPGPAFFEYESRARQNLLEFTMHGEPDYVLSIDADEFVGDPQCIHAAMRNGQPVYTLTMEEVWGADDKHLFFRKDGHWGSSLSPILWRAPKALDASWSILDRKLACGREPLAVRRTRAVPSGTQVLHFGWTRRAEREARAERYRLHDNGQFHQNAHLQSILWPDEKVRISQAPWPRGLTPMAKKIAAQANRR